MSATNLKTFGIGLQINKEKNGTESYIQEFKAKHPEWSDEQIWTAVSLDMQTDVVINEKGDDISIDDPDIIEGIIRGAMEWLDEALPVIFEKVRNFFTNLLQNLSGWIRKGLDYVMEYISNFM